MFESVRTGGTTAANLTYDELSLLKPESLLDDEIQALEEELLKEAGNNQLLFERTQHTASSHNDVRQDLADKLRVSDSLDGRDADLLLFSAQAKVTDAKALGMDTQDIQKKLEQSNARLLKLSDICSNEAVKPKLSDLTFQMLSSATEAAADAVSEATAATGSAPGL